MSSSCTQCAWTLKFRGLASWKWLEARCVPIEMRRKPKPSHHFHPMMIVVCDWTNHTYIKIFPLKIFKCRLVVLSSIFHFKNHTYMLSNTVSKNRQWDRCQTIIRIGHSKLTHGHFTSRNNPQHMRTGEDTPLTIKRFVMERPSLNNRRRRFLGFTNKTMKKLNDGDKTYGNTLRVC